MCVYIYIYMCIYIYIYFFIYTIGRDVFYLDETCRRDVETRLVWRRSVGRVVPKWLSRNIGCFTRDIHDFLTCSCSTTFEDT